MITGKARWILVLLLMLAIVGVMWQLRRGGQMVPLVPLDTSLSDEQIIAQIHREVPMGSSPTEVRAWIESRGQYIHEWSLKPGSPDQWDRRIRVLLLPSDPQERKRWRKVRKDWGEAVYPGSPTDTPVALPPGWTQNGERALGFDFDKELRLNKVYFSYPVA